MDPPRNKLHAVCVPLPAQGHINPMLNLAKLLHFHGFHITFVHSEFNYQRLIKSRGPDLVGGLDDFRFETISDGLPPTNQRSVLDFPALCQSMPVNSRPSFRELVEKLNRSPDVPPITWIVSDGVMGFTLAVAEEMGIPEIMLFTPSGCGMLAYLNFQDLIDKGYFPLKDEGCLSNGFLDTPVDWIPAMKGIRLKDFPDFIRTTDPDDTMFNYNLEAMKIAKRARGIIFNTFNELEDEVLEAVKTEFTELYTVGPLPLLRQQLCKSDYLETLSSNMWKEETESLKWLDQKDPKSVVYVNYGSHVILTPQQLDEFAWGLANSKHPFLWVMRPDIVHGGTEVLSEEFMEEIKGRGMLQGWCPQERVLQHPSVGGFLTHCGWNSTLESICEGTPLICWPFFAEQQTNCFFSCSKWGIGAEIDSYVKREKVEGLVRELMEGERGRQMREKASEWKKKAEQATGPTGSSHSDFDRLLKKLKS